MTTTYDVAVIGAGQAAVPLAGALGKAGRRVALIEEAHLGGSCVNFGCTPTKAAIASARVAHVARRAAEFGIAIDSVRVDFPKVIQRARRIVSEFRAGLDKALASMSNVEVVHGHARLEGRREGRFRISVGEKRIEAAQVVLDTGARTRVPPIEGLDAIPFITSESWLEHDELPAHLLMVGGGYIGLEMGQFYRRMGSEVTIVNAGDQVAGHEDREVAQALQEILEAEGIRIVLDAKVAALRRQGAKIAADVEAAGKRTRLEGSHVFIAAGRQPNVDGLGLDSVGIAPQRDGSIEVDARLATKVPGLWAAGDIRGGPMFTHTSWDDYRILESQMLGDGRRTLDRVVPYAVFTDPELGRVGLTEAQVKKDGRAYRVGRFEMRNDGKAREVGETTGFIKVVVDAETGLILGASVLAAEGAELVHEYVQLMNAKVPWSVMANAIHIHPTLSEAVQSAVSAIPAR
jgi:pyruvate/2-oxoglutarate dehydrogenase complex dihydrolipoamide dehydrogenase (E3) component